MEEEGRSRVRDVGNPKKRRIAKYAIDIHAENDATTMLGVLAFLRSMETDDRKRQLYLQAMGLFAEEYERIQEVPFNFFTIPVERKYLTFVTESIQPIFTQAFRFKSEEMPSLMRCLGVPAEFRLYDGSWVTGQEGMLVMLNLLAYPCRLIDKEDFFGWEHTRLCKIFKWMKHHVYSNHRQLVQNNLDWHISNMMLSKSKLAFQGKKRTLHHAHQLNPRTVHVCGSFDGFRVDICRPKDQDVQGENDEILVHLDIQSQTHNFLFLVVVDAFGLILFFDGPHLGKGTDRNAFRDSNIYTIFEEAYERFGIDADGDTFAFLGDKIFVNRPPLFLSLPFAFGEYDRIEYDRIDSKCRTASEWVNGKIAENWKAITYPNKMQLQLSTVRVDIIVAALLTNCLTILHGGQVSNYFQDENNPYNLQIPTLESYFRLI